MKNLMIYLMLIIATSCSSKSGKKNQLSLKVDTISQFANITVEHETPDKLFPILLDSANKFEPGEAIPYFFYNYFLDYEHPWLTDHKSLSLRKLVIDSTNNKELLKAILMSNDLRLKKVIDSTEISNNDLLNALPYKNVSNYDMVHIRLESKITGNK